MRGLYIGVEREAVAAEERDTSADIRTREDFEVWISPHWSAMAHFAARLAGAVDAEDVLQDALAVAWRKRDRFDASRGSARSWLLALVADQSRKMHRRTLRRRPSLDPLEARADSHVERRVDVERAIQRLTARQKLAVDLYYYLDLSIADVAAVMGCSEGTAKSTLADARARLRDHLGDEF
jgi:RNA polymerase sigma factor (sigma-70 family)